MADKQLAIRVVVGIDGNVFWEVGKKVRGDVVSVIRSRLRLDALCNKGAAWLHVGIGEGAVLLELGHVAAGSVPGTAVREVVPVSGARGRTGAGRKGPKVSAETAGTPGDTVHDTWT